MEKGDSAILSTISDTIKKYIDALSPRVISYTFRD